MTRPPALELGADDVWVTPVAVAVAAVAALLRRSRRRQRRRWAPLWRTDQPGLPVELGTHHGEVTALAALDGRVLSGGKRWPGTAVAHRPARRASRARLWQRRLGRGGDRGGRDIRWAPRHWPRGRQRGCGATSTTRQSNSAPTLMRFTGATAVAVLSDGCVVTAGSDWRVRLWRTDQPGVPIEIGTHDGEVTAVAMLGDGSVVTGGRDGRERLWRTDQPGVPMALSADDDDQMDKLVTTVHILPDGQRRLLTWTALYVCGAPTSPACPSRLAPKMRTCPYWRFPTVAS